MSFYLSSHLSTNTLLRPNTYSYRLTRTWAVLAYLRKFCTLEWPFTGFEMLIFTYVEGPFYGASACFHSGLLILLGYIIKYYIGYLIK